MGPEGFGVTLRALRQKRNMCQRKLADASGVSFWAISSLEQGRRSPSSRTIQALTSALNVKVAAFEPPAKCAKPQPRGRLKKQKG
jgi:transcriptional regulator with XRE-family HTH domain